MHDYCISSISKGTWSANTRELGFDKLGVE